MPNMNNVIRKRNSKIIKNPVQHHLPPKLAIAVKEHYNNHKCSFENKSRGKNTKLSKYAWELKERLFY